MNREFLDSALRRILARIDATLAQPGEGFPHFSDPATGRWTRTPAGDWTGGFWCAMLWLAALHTGNEKYRDQARAWALKLRPRTSSQSVFKGFLFWYGAELGSELFADPDARELSLEGTRSLMKMYSHDAKLIPLGTEAEEASDVGVNEANIDSLPGTVGLLLSYGIVLGSDEIARQHLRQHIALCVREDGSVCQSATFDPANGRLVRRYTHKGIKENSTWARAQAWGMLGLAQALAWREIEFRDTAVRVADWWVEHLPGDHVAFWDFDDPAIPNTNRDTSATAIAAAALLKLARLIPERSQRYRAVAQASVKQLVSRYLTPISQDDPREPGILIQGCFNKRFNVGTAHELIWGDYFLFETLLVIDGILAPERV